MRQADGRGHGDHFATQERELHAVLSLGHAIAHRRHAAGHLTDRIGAVQRFANDIRVVFIGLVRGQHIVVGGDDGDVVAQHAFQRGFVVGLTGRETVSQIAAGQLRTMHGVGFGLVNPCEVSRAGITRPFDNAICYP